VDGLNEFYYSSNEPLYTRQFREFVDQGTPRTSDIGFISKTSLGRAVKGIGHRFSKLLQEDQHSVQLNEKMEANLSNNSKCADPKVLDEAIQRYLQNKKLIEAASKTFGVIPIFVWQPVPTYHYDQHYHLFSEGGYGKHSCSLYGYERMAELLENTPLGNNFLWLADIQKDEKEPLYVDKVHYSARFSKQIAIAIADLLFERSLVSRTEKVTN